MGLIIKYTYLKFLLFLLIPFLSIAQINGKIVKVKDGDTVVLLDDSNNSFTIRIADIDCPERGQPFSKVAKDFVIKEIAGKRVLVEEKNKDRYGRIVGFVFYDNKNLSHELLRNGLAWHYKYYSKDSYMAKLEDSAKVNKLGLWIDPKPLNPYLFRKSKRN